MTEVEELQRTIAFGLDVEAFVKSPIGVYLADRAESEINDAMEQLKVADPENPKAIRDLQARIWRADSFQRWLAEAIQDGWQAEQAFIDNN